MADTRDTRFHARADFSPSESRALHPERSRLANWPPPFRTVLAKPRTEKAPAGDPPKRAHTRGWRITRAMFSEFEEEE